MFGVPDFRFHGESHQVNQARSKPTTARSSAPLLPPSLASPPTAPVSAAGKKCKEKPSKKLPQPLYEEQKN